MNSISSEQSFSFSILSSEFIAQVYPCYSVTDAHHFQKMARELHPKANHHCLAYRIGAESVQEFASDDGEPGGTAGVPMLNVLKRKELTNCCAIVIRYFGGTKLGKKGLIDAYRESIEKVLDLCTIKPIEKRIRFKLTYDYSQTNLIQKLFHSNSSLTIEKESFEDTVQIQASLKSEYSIDLIVRLESLEHHGIMLSDIEEYFS
ncbi:MAG: YigZ family protein [Bacteroidetes bacterium]|nr:YigZ family protein [Bacteroidota bacterium]